MPQRPFLIYTRNNSYASPLRKVLSRAYPIYRVSPPNLHPPFRTSISPDHVLIHVISIVVLPFLNPPYLKRLSFRARISLSHHHQLPDASPVDHQPPRPSISTCKCPRYILPTICQPSLYFDLRGVHQRDCNSIRLSRFSLLNFWLRNISLTCSRVDYSTKHQSSFCDRCRVPHILYLPEHLTARRLDPIVCAETPVQDLCIENGPELLHSTPFPSQ